MEHITRAVSQLSVLAQAFSFTSAPRKEYVLKAMDINPFVFTHDHRFVAVDGYAEFIPAAEGPGYTDRLNLDNLSGFFEPEGIVVAGVSSDMNKPSVGREVAKLLLDQGRSDLYFINPRGGFVIINGVEYPLYKRYEDIPVAGPGGVCRSWCTYGRFFGGIED